MIEWVLKIDGLLLRSRYGVHTAEYCDERVCLCVCFCPRWYLRNYTSDPHQIFVHVTYGHGSVLLWRRSDMLYASGFMMTSYLLISPGCSTSPPSWSARQDNACRRAQVNPLCPHVHTVHASQYSAHCTRSLGLGYKLCAVIPVAGQRTHGTTFRALKVNFNAFCIC